MSLGRRIGMAALVVALAGSLLASAAAVAEPAGRAGTRWGDGGWEKHCGAPDPAAPKRQLRAEWIASVVNIDWPSRPGLPAAEQQAELVRWLDEAVADKLNTVILQVRPTADAFWPSPLEPWSVWLTGSQGTDPGYDPLGFAVAQAHARNLELHAWFNPYRVAMHADPSQLHPDHPARVHPDWIVTYGGRLYYNPGIPEARRFTEDAILDAVRNYDIDGVHFDDYFYPYPVAGQAFDDEAAYQRYGAGQFPVKADWRRHNVDLLISELGSRIAELKPWVKFGISPFAVWRNRATDPAGSDTTAGVQTYDDLAADTRKWVREQWIDYIVPQVYWNIGFAPADYAKLVPWWSDQVSGTDVQLYIGQANYKVGVSTQHPAWLGNPAELSDHLTFNRSHPQVQGDVYFSAKDVRANRLSHMDILIAEHYAHPALVPTMPQRGGQAPRRPVIVDVRPGPDGVQIRWARTDRATASVALYRFDGARWVDRCALADARHLVATGRAAGGVLQSVTDPTAEPGRAYTYVLTALDRLHHESPASIPRWTLPG
ncbi:MAG TPA: family 10 glycosylhydrolase [Actinophytocola sp.]|uniref:glycoside hydrolase family 10 protein n=1 Tax=Actinophytocola sp. TaxID=1872138 RepID=UPI002DDD1DDC|nr:family 10 glycosylhydrolase [Actinophytocola sp.]HEV2779794.1 family 10 glycosylhydrolase [Actinophytocola sp.]